MIWPHLGTDGGLLPEKLSTFYFRVAHGTTLPADHDHKDKSGKVRTFRRVAKNFDETTTFFIDEGRWAPLRRHARPGQEARARRERPSPPALRVSPADRPWRVGSVTTSEGVQPIGYTGT